MIGSIKIVNKIAIQKGDKMINIEKLLKSKHIKVCGNKYFGYSCIVENGTSRLYSITVCGKRFYLPYKKLQ